jgi:hypothetical protein
MSKKRTSEIRLLPPRGVPLTAAQEQEAVKLLAELLLDTAAKRRGLRSDSLIDGASDGAIGSVIPFPEKRRKSRDAA